MVRAREILPSDLCESQYICVSVLSQGPRKEKRQIICSWRLNINTACAWGEPQFAQIIQFLKLCFCQYATILAAACLGTLHTPDLLTTQGYFILQLCMGCSTLWVLPLAFPSHVHGGYEARWLLTHQCRDVSATPLTPWPKVSEQPTQTFYVEGYESITVTGGILIIELFIDFLWTPAAFIFLYGLHVAVPGLLGKKSLSGALPFPQTCKKHCKIGVILCTSVNPNKVI